MNKVLFFVMISMAAMPAQAFKRAGEAPVATPAKPATPPQAAPSAPVPAQVVPASPAQVSPGADPVPVAAPKPVALPAPVIVKKAPPVKPVAEKAKPVVTVTVKERHSANGATAVKAEVDVGQAIRNAFKGDAPVKGEAKPKTLEKAGKSAAKAPPENKEEGVADRVKAGAVAAGESVESWFQRMKADNAKRQAECEADPAKCAWGND